jgi:hypothetical protein
MPLTSRALGPSKRPACTKPFSLGEPPHLSCKSGPPLETAKRADIHSAGAPCLRSSFPALPALAARAATASQDPKSHFASFLEGLLQMHRDGSLSVHTEIFARNKRNTRGVVLHSAWFYTRRGSTLSVVLHSSPLLHSPERQ